MNVSKVKMKISKMTASAAIATAFLKTLANKHRLLILCQLIEGEKSVGELEHRLGLRQSHLSQQLARLRKDGLVKTRRDSRTIFYDLESREAVLTLELLYGLFCGRGRTSRPSGLARAGARAKSRGQNGRPRVAAAMVRADNTRR